jgi:hypothetical protein
MLRGELTLAVHGLNGTIGSATITRTGRNLTMPGLLARQTVSSWLP